MCHNLLLFIPSSFFLLVASGFRLGLPTDIPTIIDPNAAQYKIPSAAGSIIVGISDKLFMLLRPCRSEPQASLAHTQCLVHTPICLSARLMGHMADHGHGHGHGVFILATSSKDDLMHTA